MKTVLALAAVALLAQSGVVRAQSYDRSQDRGSEQARPDARARLGPRPGLPDQRTGFNGSTGQREDRGYDGRGYDRRGDDRFGDGRFGDARFGVGIAVGGALTEGYAQGGAVYGPVYYYDESGARRYVDQSYQYTSSVYENAPDAYPQDQGYQAEQGVAQGPACGQWAWEPVIGRYVWAC